MESIPNDKNDENKKVEFEMVDLNIEHLNE